MYNLNRYEGYTGDDIWRQLEFLYGKLTPGFNIEFLLFDVMVALEDKLPGTLVYTSTQFGKSDTDILVSITRIVDGDHIHMYMERDSTERGARMRVVLAAMQDGILNHDEWDNAHQPGI